MNTSTQENLRRDRTALRAALIDAGCSFIRDNVVKCGFHDDQHPSASLYEKDNVWRFKCHGCGFCGDVFDVKAKASGRKVEDILRESSVQDGRMRTTKKVPANLPEAKKALAIFPTVDALAASVTGLECRPFVYANPVTKAVEMVVMRLRNADGGKRFIQAGPVDGGFTMKAPAKPWPTYNRTRCAASNEVVIVEGGKCVHALAEYGIVATTSPGGAENAKNADWSPLAGKTCYLWADNDPKGVQYMRDAAAILETLNPPARILIVDHEFLELPPKGDVVDFIAQWKGETKDQIRDLILKVLEVAAPTGPSMELLALIEDAIAGRRQAVPFNGPSLSQLSNALSPGSVVTVFGDPGCGKSFFVAEQLTTWDAKGYRPVAFMLEDDRQYHLNRILAQLDENPDLLDLGWMRAHPDKAREAFGRHREQLDSVGRCIHAAPDEEVTLPQLAAWAEAKASAGHRIIIIDPVTAAAVSDKPWLDDRKFIIEIKATARRHGVSIILMTHPRKGNKKFGGNGLDDVAGGAAYSRFSHSILLINRHEKPKTVKIAGPCGNFTTTINRTIKLAKTRNGRGAGTELGYHFQGASLRFAEQGIILDDDAPAIEDPFQPSRVPTPSMIQDPFTEEM